ncbi:MAG TPA: MBL fold metallo-hydrolase [Candidatus Paceibacterota bacterium]|nr:MBL fold metallo-hydrolase [Candidatus Paceibacterota bacterium]
MRASARIVGVAIVVLAIIAGSIWSAAIHEDRHGMLTVSFLDIGQGDAVFIQAPSGRTVLIDGGPDAGVLRKLSKELPWYQRTIDVVIPTHPDADHITGLIDVLERYKVSYVIQSSVLGSTPVWNTLENTIADAAKKRTQVITATRGQVVDLGDGAYLEVLSPDRSVPNIDTNDGCVVTRLVYGKTSFMLSCDAPSNIETYLVYLDGKNLHSDVLKAGHHGSKTSSSPLFVGFVSPSYAVYSRGCDNKYGFPSPETVATFKSFNIPTLDTCTDGTVTFTSDGQKVLLQH